VPTWTENPVETGRLIPLGLFVENPGPDAALLYVFVAHLRFEVGLPDWLAFQAEQLGLRLETFEYGTSDCGPAVNGTAVSTSSVRPYRSHLRAHVDAGRIFLLSAQAPADRSAKLQGEIAAAFDSFQLVEPTGSPALEQWLDIAASGPDFHVAAPLSWSPSKVKSNIAGKCGVGIRLVQDSLLLAHLRVKAIDLALRTQAPEVLLRTAQEELAEGGLHLKPWSEDPDLALRRVPEIANAWVTQATIGDLSAQVRFGIVPREPLCFAITLISARKDDDLLLWMRSKRAYELSLTTACPVACPPPRPGAEGLAVTLLLSGQAAQWLAGRPPASAARPDRAEESRGIPTDLPADVNDAPETIALGRKLSDSLQQLAGAGGNRQRGGVLVRGANGRVSLVVQDGGLALGFVPDLKAEQAGQVAGAFHTHPEAGGGLTFSAGDMCAFIQSGLGVEIVQSGADQYLLFRTRQTPARVDRPHVIGVYESHLSPLLAAGRPPAEATETAATATAALFRLAYYHGQAGSLERARECGRLGDGATPSPRPVAAAEQPPAPAAALQPRRGNYGVAIPAAEGPAPPNGLTQFLHALPATPEEAPPTVALPPAFQGQLAQLVATWQENLQQGGIIALLPGGGVELDVRDTGQAECFAADCAPTPGRKPLGVFHTHPAPGGGLSFSGGDFVAMLNGQAPVEMAQSGADQFLLVRTSQTPGRMNRPQVEATYQGRILKLLAAGMSLAEATQGAAAGTAAFCRLAYYRGQDGSLRRVAPV
jgi:hypothetical protein